ncbi:MAG: hypothetical protein NC120_07370 [Ruminococcus sp.]|nr:hypothetical protein [Ruminococcus sp.]
MNDEIRVQAAEASLGSDVQGTGTVSLNDDSISYRYREIHESNIERGILLTIVTTKGDINISPSAKQYHISPQIHKDSYYENHADNCYKILAEAAMKEIISDKAWKNNIIVKNRNFDEDYKLSY